MACYRVSKTRPRLFVVDLERQLLSGTIEHALNVLIAHQPDLLGFEIRY